ncbi:MAG: winged helix-turn-helix transcriptional regulator, partial [Clostridia bacterium]|nr:winged helix-turn-helix transcriptional regulator [Clostridia bacterium]
SRDALMLRLWNDDCCVEENTLTVNVNRLRRKLEGVGLTDMILTKPGSGYLIS